MVTSDLFARQHGILETIREGMFLLRGAADEATLLHAVGALTRASPFRHMQTPGGHTMSVAMTNCGQLGWVSDRTGYRYDPRDPLSGSPWPAIPQAFLEVARLAGSMAGFGAFEPDACLVNRYGAGSRLTLHQDRNERDFSHPIVSVSLGLPATFHVNLADGRTGPGRSVRLQGGDVLVWGGSARLAFHGVRELKPGAHPLARQHRYNLTFRGRHELPSSGSCRPPTL